MTEPVPAAGECAVWWAETAAASPALYQLLDPAERSRADRFHQQDDRARYVVAHALARLLASRHLHVHPADVRFAVTCRRCGGPHGKPELVGAPEPVSMSISHSGERVAVAVSPDAVGVDVEAVDRRLDPGQLVAAVLSPAEQDVFTGLPADRRKTGLLTYWTRKEALLKATADGLSVALPTITVTPPGTAAGLLDWVDRPPPATPVQLVDLSPGPGYVGAVAVLAPCPPRVVEYDAAPLLTGPDADHRPTPQHPPPPGPRG